MMKTNNLLIKYSQEKLSKIADQLTLSLPSPIDILDICNELNIIILKDVSLSSSSILEIYKNKKIIKLSEYHYTNITSAYTRHIIGHEIGHYFLNTVLNLTFSQKEYWICEELCDYFSRSLLIPTNRIHNMIQKNKNDILSLINLSQKIKKKFKVTWINSLLRIHDFVNNFIFVNFKRNLKKSQYIANKSILPNNKYLNSYLNLENDLIADLIKSKTDLLILKSEDDIFAILKRKFPIMFHDNIKEVCLYFRHNNISILSIIDHAQQGATFRRK